ncbi:MAG: acyl-CoA dehydrogenase [Alphaproteobacteria bacterium]|nr:acyl-CoA dehydrogenase [Alphaproteobacteria bacterium]
MSDISTLLAETCTRLFTDLVTADSLRAAEAGEWPGDLWPALEENGLTRPLVPEAQGGVGLTWQDTFPILFAAGYHAAPVPLAETIVAGWQLAEAGMAVPDGAITLADDQTSLDLAGSDSAWHVSGRLEQVPWAGSADHILAIAKNDDQRKLVLLERDRISVESDTNIGRDPRGAISVSDASPAAVADLPNGFMPAPMLLFAALARSAQMAGAIAGVLDLCVEYAGDREQFGRPLAKFQAIQHQLAILATEAAAAQTAAQYACRAVDVTPRASLAIQEIATAKIRTGEAAGKAAAIGHQVHGAIGFTEEYRLHYLTRRLWSWRSEFGAELLWAAHLGAVITAGGADELWPHITSLPKE